jgi:uncharacterized membrane protein YgcG
LLRLGDGVPYIQSGVSTAYVVETILNISNEIAAHFPNTTVYPVLGNHDAYPVDQLKPNGETTTAIAKMWHRMGWLDNASAATAAVAGYYTVLHAPGQRVVVANTNLYLAGDHSTAPSGTDPGGQMAWLRATLTAARNAGERVWLLAHAPLGAASTPDEYPNPPNRTIPAGSTMYNERNRELLLLLLDFADVIAASWHGHLHDDTFRLLRRSDTDAATAVQLCVPSLTTWTEENPRLRLVRYDSGSRTSGRSRISSASASMGRGDGGGRGGGDGGGDGGGGGSTKTNAPRPFDVTGWRQFVSRVDGDNAREIMAWELEYDLASEYPKLPLVGLGSNASAWETLLERMHTGVSANALLQKYLFHYHGRLASNVSCDDRPGCRAVNLCRVQHADLDAFNACLARGDAPWRP